MESNLHGHHYSDQGKPPRVHPRKLLPGAQYTEQSGSRNTPRTTHVISMSGSEQNAVWKILGSFPRVALG